MIRRVSSQRFATVRFVCFRFQNRTTKSGTRGQTDRRNRVVLSPVNRTLDRCQLIRRPVRGRPSVHAVVCGRGRSLGICGLFFFASKRTVLQTGRVFRGREGAQPPPMMELELPTFGLRNVGRYFSLSNRGIGSLLQIVIKLTVILKQR